MVLIFSMDSIPLRIILRQLETCGDNFTISQLIKLVIKVLCIFSGLTLALRQGGKVNDMLMQNIQYVLPCVAAPDLPTSGWNPRTG